MHMIFFQKYKNIYTSQLHLKHRITSDQLIGSSYMSQLHLKTKIEIFLDVKNIFSNIGRSHLRLATKSDKQLHILFM
jgi:hypothetical protein